MHPLPDGTHLLHIGPQKTGSTALQAAMHRARGTLAEHGVCYPGPGPRPREAAAAGLGFRRNDGRRKRDDDAFQRLLRQVHDPSFRRVCVSLEAFGRATDEQIHRIVDQLGGEKPHVLAVARRYDTLMPSQWQQRVKSQMALTYEEWLRIVLGDDHEEPRWVNVWVPHDTVSLVRRWSAVVGPENLTLIIGDERDRDRLPRTVEMMLDLPEGTIDTSVGRSNQSLTYPQVELLRRLNVAFHERGWKHSDYHGLVRRGLVPRLLEGSAPTTEARIPPLPGWARERLVELSERRIEGLRDLPVRVIGDPEALRVAPDPDADDIPPPAEMLAIDSALLALEGMVKASVRDLRAEQRARRRAEKGKPADVAPSRAEKQARKQQKQKQRQKKKRAQARERRADAG